MDKLLKEIGTTPVTTSISESLYPELKSPNKKVALLEKQGYIIRLKRGLCNSGFGLSINSNLPGDM